MWDWNNIIGPAAALLIVTVAATIDQRTRKIPNRLTYVGICIGIALAAIGSRSAAFHSVPLVSCLAGIAIAYALLIPIWKAGAVGAGDVKLAMAISAILGWQLGLSAILWTYISACIFGLILSARKNGVVTTSGVLFRFLKRMLLPDSITPRSSNDEAILRVRFPMGLHFAIGTMITTAGGSLL